MKLDPAESLAFLTNLQGYRLHFMDQGLWQPFTELVCRRHGLACQSLRPGLPGTFPTFLVDGRWVIKFFGPFFSGETCWRVELEASAWMKNLPEVPVAGLVASGTLEAEQDWHYLVFECLPGVSLGAVYDQLPREEILALAGRLGGVLRKMHQLPVPSETILPRLSRKCCQDWFFARWPEDRKRWPVQLADQVEGYLAANGSLLQAGDGSFIHGDLTQDHLLGQLENGRWNTLGLIDFGDAMLGNLFYELAALHLDLFACDKSLLGTFLEAYRLELADRQDFVRKAMTTSLMHQFDVIGFLFEWQPEFRQAASLEQLADRLWNLDEAGL